ncbi:unnamed protein product [Amoebophrya sp. A25]|nr:unnamed protein product [Amoebophrya sp. A25]|eukprot:GSA25T00027584001.1
MTNGISYSFRPALTRREHEDNKTHFHGDISSTPFSTYSQLLGKLIWVVDFKCGRGKTSSRAGGVLVVVLVFIFFNFYMGPD